MSGDAAPAGSSPGAPESPAAHADTGLATVKHVVNPDLRPDGGLLRERIAEASGQKPVPHHTVDERTQRGKAARATTPRQELARWERAAERPDPVALLQGQETSRVQELLPVRHARMAASAFAFYRGSALVMASDLSTMPRSGIDAQLCGDAHLANFGLFAAPDRSVVFDVNDFDETNPGPFEWDVKRLATSFVLAARDNRLQDKVARAAAERCAATYRASMTAFASMRQIDIWYDRVDVTGMQNALGAVNAAAKGADRRRVKRFEATVERSLAAARQRTAWSAIEKITEIVDGQRRFKNQPPLLTRLDVEPGARSLIDTVFREYRATLQDDRKELLKRYEIIDIGHKVVGVGSVGLLALVLLMRGRDGNDLMVLQVKQAQASVLEPFTHTSAFDKHGHRVVTGQRLMQAASDSFLGWIDGPTGRSFYVRQLRDMKWSPDLTKISAEAAVQYAQLCGHTLARAHARSGDPVAIAAYLGTGAAFDRAIVDFAVGYANQVEKDYGLFTRAIAEGRLLSNTDLSDGQGAAAASNLAAPPQQDVVADSAGSDTVVRSSS